ncbi:MAG: AvrD family protein [Rhodococcus sp. (in: high G+C Gram-positive bacteria)]|uniref:AvrD family protein n=1 Tax=Rhodococcus sp. BS-15 TaxID=1304954 RepID=UPI000AA0FDD8|nr:AvrD family protein [Rhodococcus sp. BS-15]
MKHQAALGNTITRLATVEDALGPAEGRFFGSGYKRVRQDITIDKVRSGSFTGRLNLTMPADWSTKGTTEQLPHASTIDVIVTAALIGEYLVQLRTGRETRCWVEQLTVRAPVKPAEGNSMSLSVSGTVLEYTEGSTKARIDIGEFKAEIVVSHEVAPTSISDTEAAVDLPSITPVRPHLYREAFRHHNTSVRDVDVDFAAQQAFSRLVTVFDTGTNSGSVAGIDAGDSASVNLIDAFCEALQVGQILLYDLDDLERSTSNTLWMRRLRIQADGPAARTLGPRSSTALDKAAVVEKGGSVWRTADVRYSRPGTSLVCSVAHRIGRSQDRG